MSKQIEDAISKLQTSLGEVNVDFLAIKKQVETAGDVVDSASTFADKANQVDEYLIYVTCYVLHKYIRGCCLQN